MADILTYFGMAFTGINLLLALLGTVIGSNGVQGVQTRLKRKDRFESK